MGLCTACAFAPDGRIFVATMSDNLIPSATGWRFSLCRRGYPIVFPPDQIATSEQDDLCAKMSCSPLCPGVTSRGAVCWLADAGVGATSDASAALDARDE